MKTWKKIALVAAALAAIPLSAYAIEVGQTLVQETVSPPRACTGVQSSGAIATAQYTLTIPAIPGKYIYICSFEQFVGATTAPAATLLNATTTNLGGKRWSAQMDATASEAPYIQFQPSQPLKSAIPGTAVTIVGNAAVTNIQYQADVTYYYAD